MSRFARLAQLLLLSILAIGTGGVWAQSPPPANPPPAQASAVRSTLPDSVRRVERQTGGEVLRAEPMQRDGREVYRLKVLTADGRIRVVQDDPGARGAGPAPVSRRAEDKEKQPPSHSDDAPPQY